MTKHYNEEEELISIYKILSKFRVCHPRIFPTRFMLKLVNDRLEYIDELAANMIGALMKRLTDPKSSSDNKITQMFSELDEYFHNALYYIYDFMIEFQWNGKRIYNLSVKDLHYVRSKLRHLNEFLIFSDRLNDKRHSAIGRHSSDLGSQISARKVNKSALSRDKRVRFNDTQQGETDGHQTVAGNQDIDTLAFELLIFSLSIFISQLANQSVELMSSNNDLCNQLNNVLESKRKLRTLQLLSISRQIKQANDLYLTVLDYLREIRVTYLKNYVLDILCIRDSNVVLNRYKLPTVDYFAKQIGFDVEREIVLKLTKQFLQIFLDLLVSEINLPPIEMNAATKDKSSQEIMKSRENFLNFITSWLRIDDYLFGSKVSKPQSSSKTELTSNLPKPTPVVISKHFGLNNQHAGNAKVSTIAQFKSSSRILAQMDNLTELLLDFIREVLPRIKSQSQCILMLEILYHGIEESFDSLSSILKYQITQCKLDQKTAKQIHNRFADELNNVIGSIDSIVVKTRCLKLIHIASSSDKVLKEAASKAQLQLDDRLNGLETKISQFSDACILNSRTH